MFDAVGEQVSDLLTEIGLEGPARVAAGAFLVCMALAAAWTIVVLLARAVRPDIDRGVAARRDDNPDSPKPLLARQAHLHRLNTPIESHDGIRAGDRVVAKHGTFELPVRVVEVVEQRFLGVVMKVETEEGFRFEARARDVRAAGARTGSDSIPRSAIQISAAGEIREQEIDSIRAAEGEITGRSESRGSFTRVFSRR